MSNSRHTEALIIGALKQVEAGRTANDIARVHGFPSIRSTHGVNEAQRLHQLDDDNSRLKRLVADFSPDREMLKAGSQKTA